MVELHDGVTHIADEAFAGCGNLKSIVIPSSVGMIGRDVFKGTQNITIFCEKDTFAYKHAMGNNIDIGLNI